MTLLAATCSLAGAQSSLTLEASQLYSTFRYIDSDGNNMNEEYKGLFTGGYGIGYRYAFDYGLTLHGGLGMRTGGANLVYDDMNYSWRLQYGEVKLGAGYRYDLTDRLYPYFNVSGYMGYMLRGTQTLNNEDFNITHSDILNRADYGVMFSPGAELILSDFISAYAQFSYLLGLQNLEKDNGQIARNRGGALTLGVAFAITDLN